MPNLTLNNLTGSKKQTTVLWGSDTTVYPQGWILIASNQAPTTNNAQLFKVADGINDWAALPYWVSEGALDAMVVANSPSQSNAFATLLDIPATPSVPILEVMAGSLAVFSPSDSSTTYIGLSTPLAPNATDTLRQFQLPVGTVKSAFLYVDVANTLASADDVTYYLHNITTATSTLIGTLTYDVRGNSKLVTGLSIAIANTTDYYSVEIVNPAFGTNPTNCYTICKLVIYP